MAVIALLVLLLLAGLPLAVWLDLRNLSEHSLRGQADVLDATIKSIRSFYSQNVVGRVQSAAGPTQVLHNYLDVPGAIPIPATLSLELGNIITGKDGNIRYRFFSDYPFVHHAPHAFDEFERQALALLRQNPQSPVYEISGSIFDRRIRLATPVIMGSKCVSCHNTHPESPKRDWKVGDVRGLQEIITHQAAANIFAFKYLLIYLACATTVGLAFIGLQHRQATVIRSINRALEEANAFLGAVSTKIGQVSLPATLQEHLQRPEGCSDCHRAQEAHDLFLGHRRLYCHYRAPAA